MAVLLSVLIIAVPVMPAAGADCAQIIDQTRTDAQAFQSKALDRALPLGDKYLDESLSAVEKVASDGSWRPGMTGSEEAAWAVKAGKARLDSWIAKVEAWSLEMDRVRQCVESPGCKLMNLLDQVNEDLGVWLKSLGSDAAERVAEADSLLKDYTKQLAGSGLQAAQCVAAMGDEGSVALASRGAVDLRPPEPAPPAAPAAAPPATPAPAEPAPAVKKGGGSAAPVFALLLGMGAVGAVALGYCAQNPAACGGQPTTDGNGAGTVTGHCDGTSPRNACGTCTCEVNHCNPSSQCGGGDCWTSSAMPPFCH